MLKGHTYIRKMSPAVRDAIVREYTAGDSCRTIATRHGLDHTSIWSFLKRHGSLRSYRESNRRLSVNETAFDSITQTSAYWAGMLMADGNITTRQYSTYITLALSPSDADHVVAFRTFLGSTHSLGTTSGRGYKNSKGTVRFTVASVRLAESLARFGVIPRKSKNAKVCLLDDDRHFWRGVVDGDGFLFITGEGKPVVGLVGARPLLQQFLTFVRSFHPDAGATIRQLHSIWSVRFSGKSAVRIARHLYNRCSVALPRKLAKAREILDRFG